MAKYGLIQAIKAGVQFFRNGASTTYVGIVPPQSADPASSFNFELPTALPGTTQALTCSSAGLIGFTTLSGGGSVTSVALTAPAIFSVSGSPITASGTLALSLATQTANTVWAAPSGSTGNPTFRALVYADVSAFVGTSSSTLAAGNDSRFHTQGTDSGTTQTSFQIDSGNTGPRLKNTSGVVVVRNAGDSANADLTAANVTITGNLTVSGTTTSINVETVTIDDNIIVLNNNVTSGTPTEDGGIQIRRGASTSASLIWDETNDNWKSGLAGAELRLPQYVVATFTNASLTSGSYAFTHNLANQYPMLQVIDNNGKRVFPDDATFTSGTVATFDLTSFGTLTGTWRAVAIG